GKENDNETGTQDYGFRIYNPGLGRFLSVDPLTASYPWYSPYHFGGNSPIANIDLDGGEPKPAIRGNEEGQQTWTTEERHWAVGVPGAGGAIPYNKTTTWNWHQGGLEKFNGDNETTQPGWYTSEEYINELKSTYAGQAL